MISTFGPDRPDQSCSQGILWAEWPCWL